MTATTAARRRTVRQFVPPQHGAWAMLLLPYLAGLLVAGFRWPDLPLLGAWLSGYLLSYFVLQAIKSRRPRRYRAPLSWYAPITLVLAAPVVVACPRVRQQVAAEMDRLARQYGHAVEREGESA